LVKDNCGKLSTLTCPYLSSNCPNAIGDKYLIENTNATDIYDWSVTGGSFRLNSVQSIIVTWTSLGSNLVYARPRGGAKEFSLPVSVICCSQSQKRVTRLNNAKECSSMKYIYSVSNSSLLDRYLWRVTGGNVISQNLDEITVQWTSIENNSVTMTESNCNTKSKLDIDVICCTATYLSPFPISFINCKGNIDTYKLGSISKSNDYFWSVWR